MFIVVSPIFFEHSALKFMYLKSEYDALIEGF